MLTDLQGQIERITYANEDNGFTIARVKVSGRTGLVTVVGDIMSPSPGTILKMKGEWTNHPKYGEQFKVAQYSIEVPATAYGIEKYLGSGLIKGIGPEMAGRIVRRFGEQTLDIIDREIEKLSVVEGIGKKRIRMIGQAWDEQKEIRGVMLFLHDHGLGPGYAARIFKQYGNRSIAILKENPYRLAMDIFGIGFITADKIAEKLGFARDSELRAEAGIIYILHQCADEGHVYYPHEQLLEKCREILEIDREIITRALDKVGKEKRVIIEDPSKNGKAVYLAKYHVCETGIAGRLKRLMAAPKLIRPIDSDKAIEWVQRRLEITLAQKQVQAVKCALESKVMVITGGPGTGKTTIINAVIKIFAAPSLEAKIKLAAPTGRAAKKMTEATGHEAKTIHRLLEYSVQKGGFRKDEKDPLDCRVLIIDETSMIDTVLLYHLLKAVPEEAALILVGDINQLPSVGPGNVLKDIIDSGLVPVVELNEIFRQARESRIVVNAHKINSGILPSVNTSERESDFYFVEQSDPEKVLAIILELAGERIPHRFGFDPAIDIQVLSPMHKGLVGAGNLNTELQAALNPGEAQVTRGSKNFRTGDKVMQVRNNYEKEVFNGDIGRIYRIDPVLREVIVSYEERKVTYNFSDLDEIVLAYAISVHKSQGSEYPAVIIPILTQHYVLLQRNLIYTAVTRGKKLVVMVGTRRALAIGVKNNKTRKRYTSLKSRLIPLTP